MTDLVGHLLLFGCVAVAFLIVPLLLGKLVRPKLPTPEKDAIYECGEPTIGSSYIQFDLRFYVVALLFIVFDVEVAFFFPWAMVYGGAMQLADVRISGDIRGTLSEQFMPGSGSISDATAYSMGIFGLFDVLVFFGVLLVGFAYVWKRGDLEWIRAVTPKRIATTPARKSDSSAAA